MKKRMILFLYVATYFPLLAARKLFFKMANSCIDIHNWFAIRLEK